MNLLNTLKRRATLLNKGAAVDVVQAHVHADGHGTYMLEARKKGRQLIQIVYVNELEARALAGGRNNKNLDSQLRI